MKLRKLSAILFTTALLFGATSAGAEYKTKLTLTVSNGSSQYDEAYVLTVPSDLTLSGSGWNSIGNVNVAHDSTQTTTTFDTSKKVVVTASSQNDGLTNTTDSSKKISYTFKTSESEAGDGSSTLSIEFSASEINTSGGTNKSFGIVVADTSSASNGTYEDYITYTAEVQSAATTVTVTWTGNDITTGSGKSFTKDGVTANLGGSIDADKKAFYNGGTFTTNLGNFTKIEVSATIKPSGEGWSGGTWTGTASNSVAFSEGIAQISTIVFTIEQ